MKNKFLSKLCKENNPKACNDCLSIRCICTCHKRNPYEEYENESIFNANIDEFDEFENENY